MPDGLAAFVAASVLVVVMPGADMALVTRQVLVGGPRLARRTILGNATGVLVHVLALAVGLSALLLASATAYSVVKYAGAAYLVWLGVQSLRAARRPAELPALAVPRRAFAAGLVSTVLNPKPALFFVALVPQFLDRAHPVLPQVLLLGGIHLAVTLAWLTLYAQLVSRARRALASSWVQRVTGAVLVALGVRVALER